MIESNILEVQRIVKALLYDLEKGKIDYHSEEFQFIIPAALWFTDYDLLKVIADNTLIEEDAEIVKNFIDKLESIADINEKRLDDAISNKVEGIFKGMM